MRKKLKTIVVRTLATLGAMWIIFVVAININDHLLTKSDPYWPRVTAFG